MDRIEWFGLDIRFTVDVPQDATRDILLLSDDGSSLSASTASRCFNNDGIHAPAAGEGLGQPRQRPLPPSAFATWHGPGTGIAPMLTPGSAPRTPRAGLHRPPHHQPP